MWILIPVQLKCKHNLVLKIDIFMWSNSHEYTCEYLQFAQVRGVAYWLTGDPCVPISRMTLWGRVINKLSLLGKVRVWWCYVRLRYKVNLWRLPLSGVSFDFIYTEIKSLKCKQLFTVYLQIDHSGFIFLKKKLISVKFKLEAGWDDPF